MSERWWLWRLALARWHRHWQRTERKASVPERAYGIHAMWPLPEGRGIGVCCECRTRTEIIIDLVVGAPDVATHIDLPEQAFTCDGCGTTHWFRLEPMGPQS